MVPIGQDPGTGGSYGNFGPPQPVIDITCLQPVPPAPNRASQIADSGIPRVVFFLFGVLRQNSFSLVKGKGGRWLIHGFSHRSRI